MDEAHMGPGDHSMIVGMSRIRDMAITANLPPRNIRGSSNIRNFTRPEATKTNDMPTSIRRKENGSTKVKSSTATTLTAMAMKDKKTMSNIRQKRMGIRNPRTTIPATQNINSTGHTITQSLQRPGQSSKDLSAVEMCKAWSDRSQK